MLYFLYGPDTFRLKSKLSRMQEKFLSQGAGDLTKPLVASLDADTFTNLFRSQSLLGGKQLIILEDFISEASDGVKKLALDILPTLADTPDPIVVVTESNTIPAKNKLAALLTRPKAAEQFEFLNAAQTIKWLQTLQAEKDASIPEASLKHLVEVVGLDPWRLDTELHKLIALSRSVSVTPAVIDEVVSATETYNIFPLLDAIAAKDIKTSHLYIMQHLRSGEEPVKLLATLATQLRNLIRLHDLQAAGKPRNEMAAMTKIHPFVVGKLLSNLPRFTRDQLVASYRQLALADHKLKTSDLAPEVLMAGLVNSLA